MNKCGGKIKNPCKICLQPVTNKNGLQCQGACKKWAHFTCLNFTPGKIQDIKTGYIKITCPCPGCNTTEPKEYLVNPPFTCTNQGCAANIIPRCESPECLSNKPKPAAPNKIQAKSKSRQTLQGYASDTPSEMSLTSCPLLPPYTPCPPCPPTPICPPTPPTPMCSSTPPTPICPPTPPNCCPPVESLDSSSEHLEPTLRMPCQHELPPSESRAPCSRRPQLCPESKAKNKTKMSPQKSQSCSCIIASDSKSKQLPTSTSDTILESNNQLLFKALEEMCKTVGQLSVQLKDMMCEMINSMQET